MAAENRDRVDDHIFAQTCGGAGLGRGYWATRTRRDLLIFQGRQTPFTWLMTDKHDALGIDGLRHSG